MTYDELMNMVTVEKELENKITETITDVGYQSNIVETIVRYNESDNSYFDVYIMVSFTWYMMLKATQNDIETMCETIKNDECIITSHISGLHDVTAIFRKLEDF